MARAVYRTGALPQAALDASTAFHAHHLPEITRLIAGQPDLLVVIFPPAPYDHRAWRRAAIADLARAHAPVRVVGLAAGEADAMAHTLTYLDAAPGVTGQMLAVDGASAQNQA